MNGMYRRIEGLCEEKGVNITQMCKEAGVTRGNLSDLKYGRTQELSTKNLFKLAIYFDVSMDYLLGSNEKPAIVRNNDGLTMQEVLRIIVDEIDEATKQKPDDLSDSLAREKVLIIRDIARMGEEAFKLLTDIKKVVETSHTPSLKQEK